MGLNKTTNHDFTVFYLATNVSVTKKQELQTSGILVLSDQPPLP